MAREGLNKVILIGNLGMDPEVQYTQSGMARMRMRLATTESFVKRSGERDEKTEWHTVIVWGKRAEALGKFLQKGRTICVEGSIEYRQWEDREGNKRNSTQIRARNIILLGGGGGGGRRDDFGGGGGDFGGGGG
ncbi:MAG TPA: single-stranded DNA-binding protein, partial [Polyangiaceae bacterium LLY-WYZ-15_(1-7)]|nr:single-stranded DNA-binding protein [Polyangiaceae bacterium LLY-WYZ-15_(1-7)]